MNQHERLERRAFLALLMLVSILFLFVLKPFFGAIFWAVAIALIFSPLQQALTRRWGNKPNRTALVTLLSCLVLLVIPATFVTVSLLAEAVQLYQRIEAGKFNPGQYLEQIRQGFPAIQSLLERFDIDFDALRQRIGEAAVGGSKLVATQALSLGQNTFYLLLNATLTLYLAFFLLRDGDKLVNLLIRALPIGDERERLLFAKFAEVTRATIKGSLVVAIVQGALGGLIFWILDISGALLWGVVMVVVSLIPAVGAALIWAPVAVYQVATGDWVSGLILTAFGMGVIGLVDNLLRPILVGRDTKIPDYVVLLSSLGGLSLFGVNGLVVGPLVAALFIAFWEIFMREFNPDPASPGTAE
ncbi:MAG: AI-2E family transporter [Gammaproteobacteria bacterium]